MLKTQEKYYLSDISIKYSQMGFDRKMLTFRHESDKIPSAYSEETEKYADLALPREPLDGGKGRGTPAEYTVELAPERPRPSRRAPGAPVTALPCDDTA